MAKKYIDIMDTTFRDGFQSVFGARVAMDDFLPAVSAAREAGIYHFEFGGGARFQSLFFYLNENAFDMMDKFREAAGKDAVLQTLSRGVNTVTLDTGSREVVDLHAKMFAKHNTDVIRNFDALNDVKNLEFSAGSIKKHGAKHEVVVTMMDLPAGLEGAHDAAFYERILREILDAGIPYDSVCFKDASGTSSPQKVYETIKMARSLLGDDVHIRLHTHETAGVSVACYLAALEAGVSGVDLAASPVSGGTSQPDILTMLHAVKGKNYDLGGLEPEKILKYEEVLNECLKDYFLPPEATQVSPLIPFSPMPGGALTANTQMMRDNKILDKFPAVIKAMREVVRVGGFGTSVTPVSQFYFQQAFNNVMFGQWAKIAAGYGKMVLGYFGKTPVEPDANIVKIASEQLGLEPTKEAAIDIADRDESKKLSSIAKVLEENGIEKTDENLFIVAACDQKGVAFLKGEAKVMIRKNNSAKDGKYLVSVNGNKYHVSVDGDEISVNGTTYSVDLEADKGTPVGKKPEPKKESKKAVGNENEVVASMSANVFKVQVAVGDKVIAGQSLIVLEAMKMEIPIESPRDAEVAEILTQKGATVSTGDVLVRLK
ncbi:MAG: biotin/lipoyl-containing protein [Campylobacter sp.]|nr:biotin/lipoyl-containing protein [Campylobacter sp.]